MATLFRKRNIWYVNYTTNGRRFRVSTGTSNKKLAQVKLDDLKVKIFRGDMGIPPARTSGASTSKFFGRFIEYCKNNYSHQTLESDLPRLRILQEFFAREGIKDIRSITPGVYEKFESVVLRGRKPKTRRNYLALLKTMLNYAVEWGISESNPIAKVKPPKIIKTFRFFSEREIARLIKVSDETLKTAIIILVNTGIRRGELFHLRWRDVDLKAKKLRVWPYEGFIPKGKEPRSIPLNKVTVTALKKLKQENRNTEYVFRLYRNIRTLNRGFRESAKKLGLTGTLHDLRHTFASHLAMKGIPIPVIQDLLGHSDISTTMIYSHLSPDRHHPEVDKLNF